MRFVDPLARSGTRVLVLGLALVLGTSWSVLGRAASGVTGGEQDDKRAQVKAAMIFSLLRFCTWPKAIQESGSLDVAVLGEWKEDKILRSSLKKLESRDRKLKLDFLDLEKIPVERRPEVLRSYHAILFGTLDPRDTTDVLEAIEGWPVLSIAEESKPVQRRSVIELHVDKGRYGIRVCLDLAKAGKLVLNAQLLDLAEIVPRERQP